MAVGRGGTAANVNISSRHSTIFSRYARPPFVVKWVPARTSNKLHSAACHGFRASLYNRIVSNQVQVLLQH